MRVQVEFSLGRLEAATLLAVDARSGTASVRLDASQRQRQMGFADQEVRA